MSVGPFSVEVLVVFCGTIGILHYYGNFRKQHFLVTLAVFISWFFSFLIIFILPMDLSNTCYNDCLKTNRNVTYRSIGYNRSIYTVAIECEKPWSHMPSNALPDLWRVIYWSSQLLSWILLPIMQSYVYAGAFTVWGKFKTAMFENALWYGSYLVIFGALLVYVALKPNLNIDAENLKLIGITASNTWGLLLLVILLGYGLVDLPRTAWDMSKPSLRLDITLFKVSKLSTEKEDADEDLARVLGEVKAASEEIRYNSDLRKYIDIIISKCPESSLDLFSKGTNDFVDFNRSDANSSVSIKGLTKLHKNVMIMTHRATRTQFQWNASLKLAFYLEDVLKAASNKDKIFKSSFSEQIPKSRLSMKLRWYWEILMKPGLFKLLSILLLILSVSLVWSEVTFFSSRPTLSIFAILINIAQKDYLYISMEFISCLIIAYMCACTYYTIFKVKFLNFYYFAPNHQTDSNSLLFSGLLLCRLTYAICLNFLAMIHLDGHITGQTENKKQISETDFTRFMGHMDLLSFISKGFNIYYPMTVLLVCFCTYFSLGKRLLHCIGVEQFISDDDISTDYIREGREIAKREKRKIEREIKGKDWGERSQKMRSKYANIGRRTGAERIDDSDDDELISTRIDDNPRTKLSSGGRKKYTNLDEDKVKLLSDVEYAPTDSPRRNRSYENRGSNLNSAPRNIFDDA